MTPSNYQRTRWLTLIGTIITQFALGSVYTWSLFNGALSAKLDAPVSQVAFSFDLFRQLGHFITKPFLLKFQCCYIADYSVNHFYIGNQLFLVFDELIDCTHKHGLDFFFRDM